MNSCKICNKRFKDADLLESNDGDRFCKECFKCEYCAVANRKKTTMPNRCEGDSPMKTKKMFSQGDLMHIKQERDTKAYTVFASKKPLKCPHSDCNRFVSVFDLNAHFQHEHMDIPISQARLDTRNPLTFHPSDIGYTKQCLILFNVFPVKKESSESLERQELPVTVALLASRVGASHLTDDDEESSLDEEGSNPYAWCGNDKIVIWTASNIVCNYSYTVAVSTVCEDIRVKYYGPVLQLGTSPSELCKEGQCLILSHYHFLGMSENGNKQLNLDVIVHSED